MPQDILHDGRLHGHATHLSMLHKGGGFYHRSIKSAIDRDGDTLTALDVLAKQVGIRGMFSDWPATTTFYASCVGMK